MGEPCIATDIVAPGSFVECPEDAVEGEDFCREPLHEAERTELLTEIDHLRDLLVFADGCVLANNQRWNEYDFVLADLYAEDCQWAQQTLARAGCHARGKFLSA